MSGSTQISEVDRYNSHTDQALESTPPPRRRRPDLATLSTVRREMGPVYHDMRIKRAESQHGTRLVYVQSAIAKLIGEAGIQKASGSGFGRLRSFCYCNRLGEALVDSQPIGFLLDYGITLAREVFEPIPVEHRNGPAAVRDHAELL